MRILVGITGGIAAYKAAEVVRELAERGHDVRAVPTPNALRFIGSATLEALTHNPVHSELYSDIEEVLHIELAKWAELVIVAPATASFLARTASGIADDLLGNVLLATQAPIVLAPAMHTEMWQNAATMQNVQTLQSRGYTIIEPASGRLTGSDTGVGRLPEPRTIVEDSLAILSPKSLSGKSVLVIAGGTREPIDPVRYIGNRSSGKQGIALAMEAKSRGANVFFIGANLNWSAPGIEILSAVTAKDVQTQVESIAEPIDIVVMPAAISDYRVETPDAQKIKKDALGSVITLQLVQNPDIIASLKTHENFKNSLVIGFAAETASGDTLTQIAREKLEAKQLDLIVANDVSNGKGFDSDVNSVVLLSATTKVAMSGTKREIAATILEAASSLL